MKALYILIISFLLSICLNGQSVYFDHSYNENDTLQFLTNEYITDVVKFNSRYYLCGEFRRRNSQLTQESNIVLYILDSLGNLTDKKVVKQDSTLMIAHQINIVNDTLILSGRIDEANNFGANYFMYYLTLEGDSISFYEFGEAFNGNPNNEGLASSTPAFQDGFINCGLKFTSYYNSSASIWINKVIADSIVWEIEIDNPGLIDLAIDVERNPSDSTYFVYTEQGEIINGSFVQNIILLKIDEAGNIVAQSDNIRPDSDPNNTELKDMAIDSDGNIVITGWYGLESFITKLDPNFDVVWDKNFRKYENEFLLFKHCKIDVDGNYIVAGNGGIPNAEEPNAIIAQIIKFDSETGDTIWYKEIVHYYSEDSIVPYQHYAEAFNLTPDSGFVIGGYVFFDGLPQASWVKKLDKNGCEEFNCGLPVNLNDNFQNSDLYNIKISPNPVVDVLNIEASRELNLAKYSFTDINGKIVKSGKFENQIDINEITSGVYFISFEGIEKAYQFIKQ